MTIVRIRESPSGPLRLIVIPDPPPAGMGVFCPAETSTTVNNRRVRNVSGTGQWEFNFVIPASVNPATASVMLLGFANGGGGVGVGKSITLTSDYGVVGAQLTQFTGADTRDYVIPVEQELFTIDCLPVLGDLAPGQFGGVTANHNAIGGPVGYLGIDVVWS